MKGLLTKMSEAEISVQIVLSCKFFCYGLCIN
uniref:Phosphodiesterase n=1 Tax=Parascaris univalens TaxID=6257 RepID=A0A915BHH8_PARUN